MRLRTAASIAVTLAIAVLIGVVTIGIHLFGDTAAPKEPGNYVHIQDDVCELHIVRAAPNQSVVIRPSNCAPLIKTTPLSNGLIATTSECGVLRFGPSAIPMDLDGFACAECVSPQHPPGCPFARFSGTALLRWEAIP
jgi:hypothetical protein